MHSSSKYFLDFITLLRQHEEVLLYNLLLETNASEENEIVEFLRKEYENEQLDFPDPSPEFDEKAALWSARLVYFAAQLILFRHHKVDMLEKYIPSFTDEITPSAILTADLCLRFLPDMLIQLNQIDSEDQLIGSLESILYQWHYSGIQYDLNPEKLNHDQIVLDSCLEQLYCDRIITFKKLQLAFIPSYKKRIDANLGIYASEFWKQYELETRSHDTNTKTT